MLGMLQAVHQVLKATDRAKLSGGELRSLFDLLLNAATNGTAVAQIFERNPLAWKFRLKALSRIVEKFLPNKPAPWRYQRGVRVLLQSVTNDATISEKKKPGVVATGEGGGEIKGAQDTSDAAPGDDVDIIIGNVIAHDTQEDQTTLVDKFKTTSAGAVGEQQAVESKDKEANQLELSVDGEEILPEESLELVEELAEILLQSLVHSDTVVRWSAAKCFGRLCAQLSSLFLADQLICALEERCFQTRNDRAWHGGCLALAELARRGLLLPSRLKATILPLVCEALHFEFPSSSASSSTTATSSGQHVRDAACYCVWAFARAYEASHFADCQKMLARALVPVACFDREINIRRAASAAIQEHVGRQGSFTHGIALVTLADFFSVSCRRRAYLEVASRVAALSPEYRFSLINHLLEHKLDHPDVAIREECALSLGELLCSETADDVSSSCSTAASSHHLGGSGGANGRVANSSEKDHGQKISSSGEEELCSVGASSAVDDEFTVYANEIVLPRLAANIVPPTAPATAGRTTGSAAASSSTNTVSVPLRHGSLLALAEIVRRNRVVFSAESQTVLRNLVPNGEKQRMYRGRGGEIIRYGAMRLLRAVCCNSDIVFPAEKTTKYYLQSIEECLYHSGETRIQYVAMEALSFLLQQRIAPADDSVAYQRPRVLANLNMGEMKDDRIAVSTSACEVDSLQKKEQETGTSALVEEFCGKQVERLTSSASQKADVPIATRNGALLALGWAAQFVSKETRSTCLKTLCSEVTAQNLPVETRDPISRQYAVFSLARILAASCCVTQQGGKDDNSCSIETNATSNDTTLASQTNGPELIEEEDLVLVEKALLAATQDYETDRRGDVGSWVREMALDALVHFLSYLQQKAPMTTTRTSTVDSQTQTTNRCKDIYAAILQQCVEKIDRTRLIAFAALCRAVKKVSLAVDQSAAFQVTASRTHQAKEPIAKLLMMSRPEKCGSDAAVEEPWFTALWQCCRQGGTREQHAEIEADATMTAVSKTVLQEDAAQLEDECGLFLFRRLACLLELEDFRSSLLKGLVCSVGGVTESTAKASAAALLDYGETSVLRRDGVAATLNTLSEARDERLVLPILNVQGLLLQKLQYPDGSEAERLFQNTYTLIHSKQFRGNIAVLRSALTVFLGLGHFEHSPVRRKALRVALQLLGHRFPKLREATAQALYLTLQQQTGADLAYWEELEKKDAPAETNCTSAGQAEQKSSDELLETRIPSAEIETACELLVATAWMGEEGVEDAVLRIHDLLRLPRPKSTMIGTKAAKAANKGGIANATLVKNEVQGYAQLVREFHNV
ncbi:unnamed protein product [Amoebophrya sp. A25]|nr:unnamed protein product [Amoebophrya sp. A25]|eukprot:GSA25T00000785001.1